MTNPLRQVYLPLLLTITLALLGCTAENEKGNSVQKKYSIYTMSKDGDEYIVQTDSLISGVVNGKDAGTKVVPDRLHYQLIVRNEKYYFVDWKTGIFFKYKIESNKFIKQSELQLTGIFAVENYNWVSDDTLLLFGYDEKTRKVRFAKIQVDEMKAIQGEVPVPAPAGVYNSMSVGFSRLLVDKLQIGYTYHTTTNLNGYSTSDTIYVETLSYPAMKSMSVSKDTRSAYPAGPNTRQSHFFTDEKGDFYFIACPGIASGNNPNKPTGIFRINKAETAIDQDYFFNISASPIQNHGYGLWYIGHGKAIVRTERKGIFTGMKDHWKVPHFDFYVIDLKTKTTSRLPLPLDKGTAKQCVMLENGLVYIAVNSNSDGNYIWIYNPKTSSLEKGLKFDDETDYILRIEKLN